MREWNCACEPCVLVSQCGECVCVVQEVQVRKEQRLGGLVVVVVVAMVISRRRRRKRGRRTVGISQSGHVGIPQGWVGGWVGWQQRAADRESRLG